MLASGFLLDSEGRAEQLHVELVEEGGVLCDHGVGFADLTEEGFHLACGRERDEQLSRAVADEGPGVGHVSGAEDGVAGVEGQALVTDLREELAFENVEPLVLMRVHVAGWAAFCTVGVFDDEEFAVSVLCENFEGDGGDAEVVDFLEAVFAGWDGAGQNWMKWR
jgi:hypothetical protein